jgi:hypothetical protein
MHPTIPTPRRELLAAGISPAKLDVEMRAGRAVSVFRGVHVRVGHEVGLLARIAAALKTQDLRAVATYTTAAVLHALLWLPDAWRDPDAQVHVAVPQDDARRHRDGIRLHRRLIEPRDVVLVNGVACFSVARTLVELARSPKVPMVLAVQIIDGALREERVTKDELEACLARFPGERGIARARDIVRRSRSGVDSPQETRLRLMLSQGGLPELDVPLELRDESDGEIIACGDLGYRRYLIWGEYDGFRSHVERKTFRTDRVGDRWLRRRGWCVMRFVDADLERPGMLCREWRQAIADAPSRIAAMPATRSPELALARRLLGID